MDKNSIIGIILMGLVLFGFTFYENKQYQKRAAYQAQLDSIAYVEQLKADSIAAANAAVIDSANVGSPVMDTVVRQRIFKDSLLDASHQAEGSLYTLQNDKMEIAFTTKGGQPYSVRLKDYRNYDSTDLYIFKPGESHLGIQVYAGENINTSDFNFALAEQTSRGIL